MLSIPEARRIYDADPIEENFLQYLRTVIRWGQLKGYAEQIKDVLVGIGPHPFILGSWAPGTSAEDWDQAKLDREDLAKKITETIDDSGYDWEDHIDHQKIEDLLTNPEAAGGDPLIYGGWYYEMEEDIGELPGNFSLFDMLWAYKRDRDHPKGGYVIAHNQNEGWREVAYYDSEKERQDQWERMEGEAAAEYEEFGDPWE